MAVVRKIPDVLSGPEFWVILQSQSERGVAAGGPINPFGWDTCLLTCLLEKEVDGLSNVALVFTAFRPLDVGEVQPTLGFPLEDAADVLQRIWSVGIGVVLVPIALRFLKEADDLRFSRIGQSLAEPLTSQPRSILTSEVIEPLQMERVIQINPVA